MKATSTPEPPIRVWVWGLLLTVIALFTRLKPMGDVFQEYALVPFGPDTSYHLWRMVETVAAGTPPRFDPFLNAPFGAHVIWPDGFDGAVGWFIRLLLGSDAAPGQIETAAFLLMPALGSLGVWASYLLARQLASRPVALIAAALAAMLPAHLILTVVGRIDHHILEVILPALALAMICRTALSRDVSWRHLGLGGALSGVPLALLIFTVPAALLHLGPLGAAVTMAALRALQLGRQPAAAALFRTTALACGVALLLVLPFSLQRQGWVSYEPSRLPLALLASGAAASLLLAWATKFGLRAVLAAVVALALLALTAAWILLGDAMEFVGRGGIIQLLGESQPIWRVWRQLLQLHTPGLIVTPLLFVWLLRSKDLARVAVGALGLVGLGLTSMQMRFGVLLIVPETIAWALALAWLWRRWRRAGPALALAAALACLYPAARFVWGFRVLSPERLGLVEAGIWLRTHTPDPGSRRGKASYAILTQWDMGNQLAYSADRPMVVGAMYHGDHKRALQDMLATLFGDRAGAEKLLRQRKIRYLVLPQLSPGMVQQNRALVPPAVQPGPSLYELLMSPRGQAPSTMAFRLVHESSVKIRRAGKEVPSLKIFKVIGN